MSRIEAKFAELGAKGQRALVAYVMAGFPDVESTLEAVRGLVRGGADIIELGFPFSDPLADGPTIQHAGTVSLDGGINMAQFLKLVRKIRKETDVPLVVMTYANILYRRGFAGFVADATKAGIDGFVVPDMPVEESGQYLDAVGDGADAIFLVSPNTSGARIARIAASSSGFLYLVAVFGTTGTRTGIKRYTLDAIKKAKRHAGGVPVGVGFGISTPEDVRRYVNAGADAVIVGSAFLRLIEKTPKERIGSQVASLTRRLKAQTVP